MKRLVLAAASLLACAAHVGAPAGSPAIARSDAPAQPRTTAQADAPDPSRGSAQPSPDPARHWSPQERENVRSQCQAQVGSGKFCDCLTEKLEAISPDPDTELTRDEILAGLHACQAAAPPPGQSDA